ncbi:uncharacterized protein A4U43_C10F16710 [Asparagus officinalis]|uniref:Uncharacterized protein n=1 Tax=Asparagus officinalis TaxID=4686 RepID=A0A5P1E3R2_ASPOF|nr:uncharacterized protein A4U43_C10F16710 [Asparagus officinalis]
MHSSKPPSSPNHVSSSKHSLKKIPPLHPPQRTPLRRIEPGNETNFGSTRTQPVGSSGPARRCADQGIGCLADGRLPGSGRVARAWIRVYDMLVGFCEGRAGSGLAELWAWVPRRLRGPVAHGPFDVPDVPAVSV